MKALLVLGVIVLVWSAPGLADDPDFNLAVLGERLERARMGELDGQLAPWLEVWELPDAIRAGFTAPELTLKVTGEGAYVMVGSRIYRLGDRIGPYGVLAIEPEGLVLEVDGYPVRVR